MMIEAARTSDTSITSTRLRPRKQPSLRESCRQKIPVE